MTFGSQLHSRETCFVEVRNTSCKSFAGETGSLNKLSHPVVEYLVN